MPHRSTLRRAALVFSLSLSFVVGMLVAYAPRSLAQNANSDNTQATHGRRRHHRRRHHGRRRHKSCPPDQKRCPNGKCIPKQEPCPGVTICPMGDKQCPNGDCIPEDQPCDQRPPKPHRRH